MNCKDCGGVISRAEAKWNNGFCDACVSRHVRMQPIMPLPVEGGISWVKVGKAEAD
jgi:hypothetical protein